MCLLAMIAIVSIDTGAFAQEDSDPTDAAAINAAEIQAVMNADTQAPPTDVPEPGGIDLMSLITRGGGFMIPIGLMSLLVVALAAERLLSLRRNKVIPNKLVTELDQLAAPVEKLNPKLAYLACQDHPSPTAQVIGSMLLRTGQPLGEIERTANEAAQRQADKYSAPIRWLNLAAAATPLMGLLGTVWGMIVAFHESTTLTADRSRSEQLSEGIYTALVTTLAGLAVAIPAAIFAQYLENRVSKLFHEIEQLGFDLAPGLARFTGRNRLDVEGNLHAIEGTATSSTPGTPKPPPPPRTTKKREVKAS